MTRRVAELIRLIRWAIVTAVTQGFALLLLSWILPGFVIHGLATPILAGVIISALLATSWAVIHRLAVKLQPMLFPIAMFGLTGVIIWLSALIVNSVQPHTLRLHSFGTGILVALGLTMITTIIGTFFSLNDDASYDRFVTRPLHTQFASTLPIAEPGVIFIEIDGLAEPILRQAIREGYMPTLKCWLESGKHQLRTWEPDLSSQTSASQAGILLGRNDDIPAFRWWDKTRGQLMVSSRMHTARALEEQLSTGHGLLVGGGSRWNVFSGDADDCIGVFSKLGDGNDFGHASYFAYFSNPYLLARTFGLFFADVVRERYQAWRQERHHVLPRIHRTFKYAFLRAGSTTFLQEASLFMLQADVFRGVPAVYCTLFGYDEVAHHSGIDRPDALKVLRTIDRVIARVERAVERASRPYDLVILSDHGQSQGTTFRQRYGETLADLVERLLADERHVARLPHIQEHAEHIGAALEEAAAGSGPVRLIRRTRAHRHGGQFASAEDENPDPGKHDGAVDASDVVVLASGNLGLISFPDWPERLTRELLDERFPGLLDGLRRHEGISFILVRSAVDGAIVLGADGTRYLDADRVEGNDPLAAFGPRAAHHLRRSDRFRNAPDILVMSMVDAETGEVAAFEELVGSHGGLGGTQTEPFVLHPVTFPLAHDRPIIGAADLHDRLKDAMARVQLPNGQSAGPSGGNNDGERAAVPIRDGRQLRPGLKSQAQ